MSIFNNLALENVFAKNVTIVDILAHFLKFL